MSIDMEFMYLVVAILEYINLGKVVTFSQLQSALDLRFEVYGHAGLAARDNSNIYFWIGMAESFMRAIEWLLEEREIGMEYISPILYFCDRFYLDIPPIDFQRVRFLLRDWDEYTRIIDKPTWFPVVLTPKGITVRDLLAEPISPAVLKTVLDSSDTECDWREKFKALVSKNSADLSSIELSVERRYKA